MVDNYLIPKLICKLGFQQLVQFLTRIRRIHCPPKHIYMHISAILKVRFWTNFVFRCSILKVRFWTNFVFRCCVLNLTQEVKGFLLSDQKLTKWSLGSGPRWPFLGDPNLVQNLTSSWSKTKFSKMPLFMKIILGFALNHYKITLPERYKKTQNRPTKKH